ncbi:tryptophan synthase subunit alpha [Salipaludibacillus agaradhaerens]|uniref:tryptophan synthase subunit alpha n=1 Tax=Salipaludibacillus agaradhaerens TaxID=76935 RepID=UPI002150FC86|nr:tryptophan synthase subunit alpha [Salipaludibacillus agaradhaerens]MCR6106587.1 tryptophan synthase subunit alpha [Salipaludibacillus agaradhaerens]MCR6118620.1 tryptophan synthase subunit alpha [Salipaludibacillus agaradhaerens]
MNRLTADTFRTSNDKFVPYIMSCDPSYEASIEIALALQEAGVDAIEWGVPFSDPLADGPVIQEAGERARASGGSLSKAVEGIKEARRRGLTLPVVLFTYVNPVLSIGNDRLVDQMKDADIDGLIIPDLPFEESRDLRELCGSADISLISLIAPSSKHRMKKICELGDGFLYFVTSLGVTGTREHFSDELENTLQEVTSYSNVPVLAGFGISTRDHVRFFQTVADGVIVGSALVRFIAEREKELSSPIKKENALSEIKQFVQQLIS